MTTITIPDEALDAAVHGYWKDLFPNAVFRNNQVPYMKRALAAALDAGLEDEIRKDARAKVLAEVDAALREYQELDLPGWEDEYRLFKNDRLVADADTLAELLAAIESEDAR